MAERKHHHITRLDYEYPSRSVHGFVVRIQRSKKGRRFAITQTFMDSAHGGRKGALRAALDWRDASLPLHPPARPRGGGRLHAPVGHAIYWPEIKGKHRYLAAAIKKSVTGRPAQRRVCISSVSKAEGEARLRSWLREQYAELRRRKTLSSEAVLAAYWERTQGARRNARRLRAQANRAGR